MEVARLILDHKLGWVGWRADKRHLTSRLDAVFRGVSMLNFGISLQRPLKNEGTSPVTSSLGVENIKTENEIIKSRYQPARPGAGYYNSVFSTDIFVSELHKNVSGYFSNASPTVVGIVSLLFSLAMQSAEAAPN